MNTATRKFFKHVSSITGDALRKISPLVIDPAVTHPTAEAARLVLQQAVETMFESQKAIALAVVRKLVKEEEEKPPLADLIDEAIKKEYSKLVDAAAAQLEQAALA